MVIPASIACSFWRDFSLIKASASKDSKNLCVMVRVMPKGSSNSLLSAKITLLWPKVTSAPNYIALTLPWP